MSILSDKQIGELCTGEEPMLSPFYRSSIKEDFAGTKILSYGVSSYGYDATLAKKVYVFTNQNGTTIDPRKFSDDIYIEARILTDEDDLEYFILPPNSYALGYTNEYFKMPRNVTALCIGKSTYARSGLMINCTPIEAGWHGNVVLELANMCGLPIKVYINQGIAQFLFFSGEDCITSYADRGGKYQNQTNITLPKV